MDKIEFVSYKGKKLPFLIDDKAIILMNNELESVKNLMFLSPRIFEYTVSEPLLYYSLISGHKAMNLEMSIPRKKIRFILLDNWTQFTNSIVKIDQVMKMKHKEIRTKPILNN
jgi:hypothetical protein